MSIVLALSLLDLASSPLLAAQAKRPPSHVEAALLSEYDSIQPGRPFTLGVRLRMKDGWHTYWRNPGDTGMPTAILWRLPQGFRAGELQWPAPRRFVKPRSVSYDYPDEALLLTEISAPRGLSERSPAELAATVSWLECKEICLPGQARLSLKLPVRSAPPGRAQATAKVFAEARRRLPKGLGSGFSARAIRQGDRIVLTLESPGPLDAAGAAFFPYDDGVIEHDQPQTARAAGRSLTLGLVPSRAPDSEKTRRLAGVVTFAEEDQAIELSVPIETPIKGR